MFKSDGDVTRPGFLAIWSQYTVPTGCNNCDFPFTFGAVTFESCISVKDADSQPWCSVSPPVINTAVKITCSNSDSSCPSSSPQMLVTSPDYPLTYPSNSDQVKLHN